jgi:6,7-dimethyl-8-ribityllumazine synthase
MTEATAPRVFAGDCPPTGGVRIAIVVSRWNEQVTRRLLDGAVGRLAAAGIGAAAVDVAWVPGSFELPAAADRLAMTGRYAAVLCLGAIIKGETTHDRIIAQAVARGIEETARHHGLPVLFGVLTCDTLAQALARAAADPADNKGAECAAAALSMIALFAELPGAASSVAAAGAGR